MWGTGTWWRKPSPRPTPTCSTSTGTALRPMARSGSALTSATARTPRMISPGQSMIVIQPQVFIPTHRLLSSFCNSLYSSIVLVFLNNWLPVFHKIIKKISSKNIMKNITKNMLRGLKSPEYHLVGPGRKLLLKTSQLQCGDVCDDHLGSESPPLTISRSRSLIRSSQLPLMLSMSVLQDRL